MENYHIEKNEILIKSEVENSHVCSQVYCLGSRKKLFNKIFLQNILVFNISKKTSWGGDNVRVLKWYIHTSTLGGVGLGSLAKVEEDEERSSKEAGMIPGFKITIDNGISKNIYDNQIFSCKPDLEHQLPKFSMKYLVSVF